MCSAKQFVVTPLQRLRRSERVTGLKWVETEDEVFEFLVKSKSVLEIQISIAP